MPDHRHTVTICQDDNILNAIGLIDEILIEEGQVIIHLTNRTNVIRSLDTCVMTAFDDGTYSLQLEICDE